MASGNGSCSHNSDTNRSHGNSSSSASVEFPSKLEMNVEEMAVWW